MSNLDEVLVLYININGTVKKASITSKAFDEICADNELSPAVFKVELLPGAEAISGFSYLSNLEEVVVSEGVTSIGIGAFKDCTSLKKVELPRSLKEIGLKCFSGCERLESIKIPDKVTKIGDSAFSKCTSLTGVSLPSDLKVLGMNAFADCTSLKNIYFTPSLGGFCQFQSKAFARCTSLEEIFIPRELSLENWTVFEGCTNVKQIQTPYRTDYSLDLARYLFSHFPKLEEYKTLNKKFTRDDVAKTNDDSIR